MKYILRTIVMALGCLLSAGVAEANQQLWKSTAKIIKVSDLLPSGCNDSVPFSRTGAIVGTVKKSDKRAIFTVSRNKEEVVDSETPYLVLFPVFDSDGTTLDVLACRAIFSAKDDRLMLLTVNNHRNLPEVLTSMPREKSVITGSNATMISFGYDRLAHAENKDPQNNEKINKALDHLWKQVKSGGVASVTNCDASWFTAFMSFMNVHQQTNPIASSSSIGTDTNRFYIQNMEIREHMVGAPVFVDGVLVGMSEAAENRKGDCEFISMNVIDSLAGKHNVILETSGAGAVTKASATVADEKKDATPAPAPQAESDNLVKGLLIAAVVLVVLLLVVVILKKRGNGGGGGSSPKLVMTLKGSDGKTIQVTSKMVRNNASLGRSSSCDIKLEDSSVSSHHAHFCAVGSRAAIQDDGSKNGSFVNGERLQPGSPKTLHPGDVIKLGTYELRVL